MPVDIIMTTDFNCVYELCCNLISTISKSWNAPKHCSLVTSLSPVALNNYFVLLTCRFICSALYPMPASHLHLDVIRHCKLTMMETKGWSSPSNLVCPMSSLLVKSNPILLNPLPQSSLNSFSHTPHWYRHYSCPTLIHQWTLLVLPSKYSHNLRTCHRIYCCQSSSCFYYLLPGLLRQPPIWRPSFHHDALQFSLTINQTCPLKS